MGQSQKSSASQIIEKGEAAMKKLAMSLLLCVLCVSHSTYAGDNAKRPRTWNLSKDLLGTLNQISFNQGARGVWYFMESNSISHDPSIYKFLTDYEAPCVGNPTASVPINGVSCWQDPSHTLDHNPSILFNFTDATQFPFGPPLAFPPHSLVMHPAPDRFAIVAWRSPVRGAVNVTGSFTHLNVCGNGVLWFVDKGTDTLASGDIFENGESFNLPRIRVSQGQVLYFVLDPKDGNYFCDSTLLDVTIAAVTEND